ncbi:response regulator [Dongshaea marina]|uniref:response regulator n=1 Tax=Dongshaea marina TaxID=2047966 RepID=UPI001900F2D8|nr:response regulator [Dongshaea marina]
MTKETSHKLRLLVVDDHELIVDGLKSMFADIPSLEVVGQVENGLEVYTECQQLQPDLLLIDLMLPGLNGIDVIYQIRKRWTEMGIIALTSVCEEHKAREALDAGANGYVLKNSSRQILLSAIEMVREGKRFIDPSLQAAFIQPQPGKMSRNLRFLPAESARC